MWELDHKRTESWRSDAFGLWCWRRLLRVPWTARRSNQSILKEIIPGCSLEGLMLKLKLQYFGHLMQRVDSLEKTLMVGSESEVSQLCPTLCDPVDYSPPGSSVHGILQARILEWVAISFSRGSYGPRDRIQVSALWADALTSEPPLPALMMGRWAQIGGGNTGKRWLDPITNSVDMNITVQR